jgi:hypothetical protein
VDKVPVVPGLSRREIEARAVTLLRKFQPEAFEGKCPADIEMIFEIYIRERYRIKTGYTDLSSLGQGVLGYTDAAKKISYVDKTLIDANDLPTVRRCRATVGHESGHCLYHVSVLNFFKSSSLIGNDEGFYRRKRTEIKAYLDPEWQAWEFARAYLMPRHLIVNYYDRGYSVRDMAECFNVNPAFIEVRLKTLKIKPF